MKTFEIKKHAIAGTLESSDCQVLIDKNPGKGIEVQLNSVVEKQFGNTIRKLIEETLENLGVQEVKLSVEDKGALDCTIKARVIAAVYRAAERTETIDWEEIESWNV